MMGVVCVCVFLTVFERFTYIYSKLVETLEQVYERASVLDLI